MTEAPSPQGQLAETSAADTPRLGPAIFRYALTRLLIIAVVTAVLTLVKVPLLVAIMVALVAAVPLSLLLLKRPRRDLNAALAQTGARRRAQKAELMAQLRGEDDRSSSAGGSRETDGAAE